MYLHGIAKIGLLLLVFSAAMPAFAQVNQVLEEVVASAPSKCGPWPLAHEISARCEYQVLKQELLALVSSMRAPLLSACLSCAADNCTPRQLPIEERRICHLVFMTPKRIISLNSALSHKTKSFDVRFSYEISPSGQVQNIAVLTSRGAPATQLLALIREGASQARYEPVHHGGRAISLTGLTAAYVMQVRE